MSTPQDERTHNQPVAPEPPALAPPTASEAHARGIPVLGAAGAFGGKQFGPIRQWNAPAWYVHVLHELAAEFEQRMDDAATHGMDKYDRGRNMQTRENLKATADYLAHLVAECEQRIAAVRAEQAQTIERLTRIIEIKDAWIDATALCPDHRDKFKRGKCLACRAEAAEAALANHVIQCPQCQSVAVEAALALAREGWQPIETAPKDGTEILAFDEGAIVFAVYADDGEHRSGWYDHGLMEPAPTHWMPLPAPPAAERAEPTTK